MYDCETKKIRDRTDEEESIFEQNKTYENQGKSYEELVIDLIREKYSIDEEFAILRQRDTKPDEFEEYNAYCEECKEKAKKLTVEKQVEEE
jgi:hypothetical protein